MQILCVFYIKRPFEKYHNTLSCPSKIFCKHCFQFLLGPKSGRCGRDEKRAANSGGGGATKPSLLSSCGFQFLWFTSLGRCSSEGVGCVFVEILQSQT